MKHPKEYDSTPEARKRMAHVHLKKGVAEISLAKALWHEGIRYRLNYKMLPGSPDIAITSRRVAIFIDGEFWHGYDWETRKPKLKSNREYWIEKIEENMARDTRNDKALTNTGWLSLHFWEKEVKKDLSGCVESVLSALEGR